MADNQAPPVDWRELRSGTPQHPGDGQLRPPGMERHSTSEGDMRRASYRKSGYPEHFTLAAANDDGTPIGEGTEVLLAHILAELRTQTVLLQKLLADALVSS